MRLLTTSGDLVSVQERGYPLSGVDYPSRYSQGNSLIRLSTSATDAQRFATYTRLYKENPWVYAAVKSIAWGLSRMPSKVFEMQGDGQRVRVRGDLPGTVGRPSSGAQLDNLLRRPSPQMGRQRFWRGVMTDSLVFGNGLIAKERQNGAIVGLHRLPWRKITVVEGDTVPILYYELVGQKQTKRFVPEDVIHISTGDDPESPIGQSPIASLKYTLALHEALQRHLVHFFENQARPSGNLKLANPNAPKETMEFIRNQVRELYTAPENAGKVIVTTGDWQTITESAEHASIIDLVKASREEIAAAFRIPLPVLGILDRAIMSNVRELREQYIRDVVGGWAPIIEDELHAQLLPDNPNWTHLFIEFDLDEQLRPDLEARAKALKDLESTYTTNERRRLENLPDIEREEADTVVTPPGAGYMGVTPPMVAPGAGAPGAGENK